MRRRRRSRLSGARVRVALALALLAALTSLGCRKNVDHIPIGG